MVETKTDDVLISDLDALLSSQSKTRQEEDVGSKNSSCSSGGVLVMQPNEWPEIKVNGTSITIVSVLLDDSYSIQDRGIAEKLNEGVNDMIGELKSIASKGKEIFLNITGFSKKYFCGNVLDADPKKILDRVYFDHDCTPLVETAARLVKNTEYAETTLNDQGISVAVSMLLITDGFPREDNLYPPEFKKNCVQKHSHWNFAGMGITRHHEYHASGDRKVFTELFEEMGINKIVTPSSNGLKEALYQFSRSVSAI